MAAFKITLLVLAVLGMAQGHSLAKRATLDPLQFIGDAKKSMDAALSTVAASSTELITKVDAAKAQLQGYIDMAKAMQQKVKDSAQAQINTIVANAATAASKQNGTQACLTKKVGEVEGLGLQTMLDIVDCLGAKITQLENLLSKVLSTADTAITMAPAAVVDINNCHVTGGFWEGLCNVMAAASFVGKVNSVVGNVTSIVAEATALVSTIQADLTTCASLQVAKMTVSASVLVGQFAICSVTSVIG